MKTNQGTAENAVEAVANVCVASCQNLAAQIERARKNLLAELKESLQAPEQLFRLALNEAEALAWQTEYPHLLFPALAAEKVQAVARWNRQQELLRQRNSAVALSI